ncbi:hypothetical protein, partial [Escherichia coli]|uniref:hypothetical protein n=1 Tax=Escherichia coli TaxID=562 RepID=UPI0035B6A112
IFSCVVRRLRFSGPKTSIICSPMTSLKTSIKTITYLSDTGCLEIQGASLHLYIVVFLDPFQKYYFLDTNNYIHLAIF